MTSALVPFAAEHLPALSDFSKQLWERPESSDYFTWRYLECPKQTGLVALRGTCCVATLWAVKRDYVVGGQRTTLLEPFDWYVRPELIDSGTGVRVMRSLMTHPEPMIIVGGTDYTRRFLPRLGWRVSGVTRSYVLPLSSRALTPRIEQGVRLPRFALKTEGDKPRENLEEEIQSATARMHTRLGDRLRQRGRARAAVSEYRRALRQDPYSPYLLNKLASTLLGQQRWQEALPPLQRARALAPDYGTTYVNLGRVYVALGEYEHARQALREAIQINPFDPSVHLHLAESYRRLGRAEQAEQAHNLFKKLQETP